jgi:eukaryotic-like serine/threonine-protein kinase
MDETTPLGGNRRLVAERYELRGLIGQGGMADVEVAQDRVLDRQVAVKMLHQRYADDQSFIDRFRREAQSAASLNHPNVVAVYDTGEDGHRPFIVMEYVAGRSLRDVMRQEGILPERAAEITADAAQALHYAHERGLVHRDVKPGNIMISDEGQVKVTDFGIARAVSAETVTQTAAVFGTAAYVSPEQAQGERVDRRTDIYSLGCVLYEMLTGRQPFTGDSAVAMAYKHVAEPPVPPCDLNPDVSEELEAVCLKALAKHPDDRYQTAQEFYEDLSRAVGGLAVTAALGAGAYPATEVTRPVEEEWPEEEEEGRRRWPLLLLLALLALVVLGAMALAGFFDRDVPQVEMPDVIGMDLADAQRDLFQAGFDVETEEQEDPEAEENEVLETDPEPGELVDEGSTVTIFYNTGPPLVEVPDVTGEPEETAVATLTDAGFTIGTRTTTTSDDVDAGDIVSTTPPGGTEHPEGEEVDIVVSEGPSTLTVPDVRGVNVGTALEELRDFCGNPVCLAVTEAGDREFSNTVSSGAVIRQSPEAGAQVQRGSTVQVIVSAGPEPAPDPEPEPEPDDDDNDDNDNDNGAPSPPTPTPPPTPNEDNSAPTPDQGNGEGDRSGNGEDPRTGSVNTGGGGGDPGPPDGAGPETEPG